MQLFIIAFNTWLVKISIYYNQKRFYPSGGQYVMPYYIIYTLTSKEVWITGVYFWSVQSVDPNPIEYLRNHVKKKKNTLKTRRNHICHIKQLKFSIQNEFSRVRRHLVFIIIVSISLQCSFIWSRTIIISMS